MHAFDDDDNGASAAIREVGALRSVREMPSRRGVVWSIGFLRAATIHGAPRNECGGHLAFRAWFVAWLELLIPLGKRHGR